MSLPANRCGSCKACEYIKSTQKIMLSFTKEGGHYSSHDVQWWNKILAKNPCTNPPQQQEVPLCPDPS